MKHNYAAHQLVVSADVRLPQHVVTLEEGRVLNWYPLEGEPPFTQWLGGAIILSPRNILPDTMQWPMSLDELIALLAARGDGSSIRYAWHVTPADIAAGRVSSVRLLR